MTRFPLAITAVFCSLLLSGFDGERFDGERKERPPRVVVVEGTLEAARGQPLVSVQLRDDDRVLTGDPDLLEAAAGDDRRRTSFPAYLDTGSSSLVLSASTARRFGVAAVPDAVYLEAGLRGDVAMGVSSPYRLGLAGLDRIDARPAVHELVLPRAAFQLNHAKPSALMQVAGALDVIGMPAIEKLVIEIDPTPLAAAIPPDDPIAAISGLMGAPAVHLHDRGKRPPGRALTVALEMEDFSRKRHPGHAGPRPALASNPMVAVTTEHGATQVEGQWLFDTGAAATVISRKTATTLGLLDAQGAPTRPPDYTLPLGGISGRVDVAPGFIIDRLLVPAMRNTVIEFRHAHVVVHDVVIELTPGETRSLDGILGMNLLFPSASGIGEGMPTATAPPPFRRVWIDGPRRRLVLETTETAAVRPRKRRR